MKIKIKIKYMDYFCDNSCKIINNLMIQDKQYFIVIYIKDIKYSKDEKKSVYTIFISLDGVGINLNNNTATCSVTYTGSTNNTDGIANTYVDFFNEAVKLLLSTFSKNPYFKNCSLTTTTREFNAINKIGLVTTDIMYFSFDILNLKVNRQESQIIDVFVSYLYIDFYNIFDYKQLRQEILDILLNVIDANTKWEYLALFIAQTSYHKYNKFISGIKIQIVVKDNPNGNISEPGNHGATYNYGKFIAPPQYYHLSF